MYILSTGIPCIQLGGDDLKSRPLQWYPRLEGWGGSAQQVLGASAMNDRGCGKARVWSMPAPSSGICNGCYCLAGFIILEDYCYIDTLHVPNLWTPHTYMSLLDISFQNHGHYCGVSPSHFSALSSSTLLVRLFTRFWRVSMEICAHFVRSGTDVR